MAITLSSRDRRALLLLGPVVVLVILFRAFSGGGGAPAVVQPVDSMAVAERRLAWVRQKAAGVQGREAVLKQVTAELAEREKGMIQAETAAQAQAQLLDVMRRVAKAQNPPLEFGTQELGQEVKKLGEDYGVVEVSLPFVCHVEDLLNFLAALTQQAEALATTDLRVAQADPKKKTITVRLTVAAVVPGRLVPVKKGIF
jgi:hypothetical protein